MSSSLNIHLFLNKKSTRPRTSCWHHGDVSFVHNRIENSLIQKLDETWSQEGIRVMSPSNSLPISSFFLFPPSLSLPLFLSLFLCHARYALLLSFSFSRSPSHVLFFSFSRSFSLTSFLSCGLFLILGLFIETKVDREGNWGLGEGKHKMISMQSWPFDIVKSSTQQYTPNSSIAR